MSGRYQECIGLYSVNRKVAGSGDVYVFLRNVFTTGGQSLQCDLFEEKFFSFSRKCYNDDAYCDALATAKLQQSNANVAALRSLLARQRAPILQILQGMVLHD